MDGVANVFFKAELIYDIYGVVSVNSKKNCIWNIRSFFLFQPDKTKFVKFPDIDASL